MKEIPNKDFSENPQNNYIKKEPIKSKLSSIQFALSPNLSTLNTEKPNELSNQAFPLKSKSLRSMKLNFLDNELRENAGFKLYSENISNRNLNSTYSANEEEKNLIKSKFKNQSELNVSLNFLRGKSLRKSEIKNTFKESLAKSIMSKSNLSNTIGIVSNNTENNFKKFFKKPLTFRINEFEEKNLIEKDDKNKQNKTYAQQKFFAHTMNGNNNINSNLAAKNNSASNNNTNASKNSNLDDIEKVMLVNNEEELVKKYLLPEIKYLSTNERNKLFNYDVNDNSDKFIIKKSNGIFLSDLLKNGGDSPKGGSAAKAKINEKELFELSKTKVNLIETKFGMFPKFLMKTSRFVKFGEAAAAKKLDFKCENRNNSVNTKDFHNNFDAYYNLKNFILKNNYSNNNDKQIINNRNTLNIKNNKIHVENDFCYINEKSKLINKTSSAFNYRQKNPSNDASNIMNLDNTIKNENINDNAILSPFNSNFSHINNNNNPSNTCFISSNGYEINREKYSTVNNRKHNRKIFLDYPQIKFPIQPYKRITVKKKENPNYLTNGSLIRDPKTIKIIKLANEKIAKCLENEKGKIVSDEMSQNLENLGKIESKIADLIEISRVKIKDRIEYNKFSSNNSIVIIK
jgi:hypothetical protein